MLSRYANRSIVVFVNCCEISLTAGSKFVVFSPFSISIYAICEDGDESVSLERIRTVETEHITAWCSEAKVVAVGTSTNRIKVLYQ